MNRQYRNIFFFFKDFHRHGGFVLRSSNQNVEPPYSAQYSTFYTSYILSVDVPVFFLYRCLRYSFSLRGQSTFIVSYLVTEEKSDVIIKEYQANWMGKTKEGWIVGNGSVNLPLKPTFRVRIMLELVGFFIDWFACPLFQLLSLGNSKSKRLVINDSRPVLDLQIQIFNNLIWIWNYFPGHWFLGSSIVYFNIWWLQKTLRIDMLNLYL